MPSYGVLNSVCTGLASKQLLVGLWYVSLPFNFNFIFKRYFNFIRCENYVLNLYNLNLVLKVIYEGYNLTIVYNILPSWQETYAGKNKTSHFSWMVTELTRQRWLLEVKETARKFYKQKTRLGWQINVLSCTILKHKTISSLMVMDIFVNIYLGTFMLYITEQIKYGKITSQG